MIKTLVSIKLGSFYYDSVINDQLTSDRGFPQTNSRKIYLLQLIFAATLLYFLSRINSFFSRQPTKMFPVHFINPFVQQQRQGRCPGFARSGSLNNSQPEFWPFVDNRCGNRQCTNPGFDQENMYSPISIFLQRLHDLRQTKFDKNGKSTGKNEQENCNKSQSCKKQEKGSLAGSDNQRETLKRIYPFQPIGLNDLMNIRSTQYIPRAARESDKWQQKVDCRGFESRNIKVKIDTCQLLIKAFKKEKSEDGVSTSSLRKMIVLPENINTKKITCKLSPNGILLIEAPLLDKENQNNKRNCVTELMSMMLPGWKEFLEQYSDSDNVASEKENEEKSDENSKDQQGENKNPITELMSMMLPRWKEFLEQHSDNVESEKENEEKSDENSTSKDQQGENTNPITELMSMIFPGWKEFLEQHSDKVTSEKENQEKSDEKSRDDLEKNEKEAIIAEVPVNHDDENSSTEQESGTLCNKDVVCETEMEVSDNDNPGDELTTVKQSVVKNNEQLVVAFKNDKQDTEVHDDDDGASNSSNESFILLSQLEDERNDGDKDPSKNATTIENIEEEDEKAHGSNEADSVMESEDLTINKSHNVIDDSERESNSNKQWEFRLEMPSYNPASLKVSFEESTRLLEISATKEDLRSGKPVSIVKSVHISDIVDVNGLKCRFRDGLLSLTAPYMNALRSIPISM